MTYITLTIGPIYRTLSEAKRTRAVWAASYFFSWFMRRILEEAKIENLSIFLPDDSEIYTAKYGAGLYADRLYFRQEEKTTKAALEKIAEKVIKEVEIESNGEIKADFLRAYLNLHLIEKEITDEEVKQKDSYPLAILNAALDQKELQQNYNFDFETNQLQEYFVNKTRDDETFLAADAFPNQNERQFRSISEIATTSFSRLPKLKDNYNQAVRKSFKEDKDLMQELKSFDMKPHHKYFAVIYADGDYIGKILAEVHKNIEKLEIKDFSKALFEFGKKAEEAIYNYGGNGIYLGGEDILAFVPAACVQEGGQIRATFFQLIQDLDKAFEETVAKYADDNKLTIPSMSYGIMLSYYKNPLKEAMKEAHSLLDDKAKKRTCKNAIAFRFQKHSGQYMECVIEKSKKCSLSAIYEVIEKYCKVEIDVSDEKTKINLDKREKLLSSIIQRFRDEVFVNLYFEATKNKNLAAFFANFFNEDIHKTDDKAVFLNDVKNLSEKIINDYPDINDCKNILFTVLRYIHFINSQREQ